MDCALFKEKQRHVALENTIVNVQKEIEEAKNICRMQIPPTEDPIVNLYYLLRPIEDTEEPGRLEVGERVAVRKGGT